MPVLKFEKEYKSMFNQQIPTTERQIKVIPFFVNPADNNVYIALSRTNNGKSFTFAGSSVLNYEGSYPSQEDFQNTIHFASRFNFDRDMDNYWSILCQYLRFPVYDRREHKYVEKDHHITMCFQLLSMDEVNEIAYKKGENVLFQTVNVEEGFNYNPIAQAFLEQNGGEFINQLIRGIEKNIGKKE